MRLNWKNTNFFGKIGKYISANGSTLTMVGGLATLAGALYAAYKAAGEVSEINDDFNAEVEEITSEAISEDEKAKKLREVKSMRNIKLLFAYKWALLLGGSSAVFIFLTKYLDGLAISGLTALAVSQEDKLKKLMESAKETLGEEKFREIENKALEKMVEENFVTEDGEPIVLNFTGGEGNVFVDESNGAIFRMRLDRITNAITYGEQYYKSHNNELPFDKWWTDILGLPEELPNGKKINKYVVWGPNNPFGAKISHDNFPKLAMSACTLYYTNLPQSPDLAGLKAPWIK